MIIESGIDVLQALCGSVSSDNPDGVWIVAMDENLRLLYVEPVVRGLTGDGAQRRDDIEHPLVDIEQHIDDIAQYLEAARDISYYALGWTTPVEVDRDSTWLADVDRRLHDDPGLAVARLLGIIVFDRSSLYASLPRCEFSIERGFQDLPRAMALAGPHGLDCSCPPCAAERREFDAAYDYEPYDYEPYGYQPDVYQPDVYQPDVYRPHEYEPYDEYPGFGEHPAGYGGSGGSTSYRRSRRRRRRGLPRLYDPDYEPPTSLDNPRFDEFTNRWYPPPARAGKRWTREEEQTIVLSHDQGLSCFDISLLVLRQPGAVASRLNKLGLSSATVGRAL